MSKEALEYITDKLGLAIDWTAENIYPQMLDALSRYRAYKICLGSLGLVLGLALVTTAIILFYKLIKDRALCASTKKDTRFHQYYNFLEEVSLSADDGFTAEVCAIFAAIFGTILTIACTCIVLKWSFAPEVAFVGMIAHMGG